MIDFTFHEILPLKLKGDFLLENLDISELTRSINEKILITGIINISGNFYFQKKDFEFEIIFETVKKRGIKQYMNFGAIELLTSLSGTNPIRTIGSSNFYYKKMAGKITLKNKYLTIEGLAGQKGENQYLIIKPFFMPGINILVDKRTNTIKLDELIERVKIAVERIKKF